MKQKPAPIRAALSGSRTCEAEGITVFASSPVLKLCRELIRRGFDPHREMEVYRRDKLVLTVLSIGEAAILRATERGDGRPVFALSHDAAPEQNELNAKERAQIEKIKRAA